MKKELMKSFDELMADARDCEKAARKYATAEVDDGEDTVTAYEEIADGSYQAGHRAAMDRMEPALREAIQAFEDIQDDAEGVTDFGNNQTKKRIAGLCLSKIREILAKGAG